MYMYLCEKIGTTMEINPRLYCATLVTLKRSLCVYVFFLLTHKINQSIQTVPLSIDEWKETSVTKHQKVE